MLRNKPSSREKVLGIVHLINSLFNKTFRSLELVQILLYLCLFILIYVFFHVACMGFIEYFQFLSQVWKTDVNFELQKIVISITGVSVLSTENSVNSGFLQAASCFGKNLPCPVTVTSWDNMYYFNNNHYIISF